MGREHVSLGLGEDIQVIMVLLGNQLEEKGIGRGHGKEGGVGGC